MCNYILSKYNIIINDSKKNTILYNTYSAQLYIMDSEIMKIYDDISINQRKINSNNFPLFEVFLNKGFIVSDDVEEWEFIDNNFYKEIYSNNELILTILTTDDCNFRCVYCYEKHGKHYMTMNTAESILKFIDRKTKKNFSKLHISWFGGEPLLTKNLIVYMSKEIKKIAHKNKFAYVAQMTTNGYDLTHEVFNELLSCNILTYNITIDGVDDIHNKQRPHITGKETYQTILNNLINIKKNIATNRFTIYIRSNIGQEGLKRIESFGEVFAKEFGDDLRFRFMIEVIREKTPNGLYKQIDEYKEIYNFYEYFSKKGINMSSYLQLKDIGHICSAVNKNGYVLDWDGNILKCSSAIFSNNEYAKENHIGYIEKNGDYVLDDRQEAKWMIRNTEKYNCHDCKLYPKCLGVKCVLSSKYIDKENDKCSFYASYLEYVKSSILANIF